MADIARLCPPGRLTRSCVAVDRVYFRHGDSRVRAPRYPAVIIVQGLRRGAGYSSGYGSRALPSVDSGAPATSSARLPGCIVITLPGPLRIIPCPVNLCHADL